MIRTTLTAAALALGTLVLPAMADTAGVLCWTQQAGQARTETKDCGFSQRQGNVRVYRGSVDYLFLASEQGKSYQRTNSAEGILFETPGGALQVIWKGGN